MSWVGDIPFKEIGMNEDKMQLLGELAEDNNYWRNALKFVKQVSSRKLYTLSNSQRGWLFDIDATLGVELNKRATKEVFDDTGPRQP